MKVFLGSGFFLEVEKQMINGAWIYKKKNNCKYIGMPLKTHNTRKPELFHSISHTFFVKKCNSFTTEMNRKFSFELMWNMRLGLFRINKLFIKECNHNLIRAGARRNYFNIKTVVKLEFLFLISQKIEKPMLPLVPRALLLPCATKSKMPIFPK